MSLQENLSAALPSRFSGLWHLLLGIWKRQKDANAGLLAAGIAFYGLLSLFPAITAATALAGIAMTPSALAENSQTLTNILPEEAGSIIIKELRSVLAADESTLGFAAIATLGLALYSASRATAQTMTGLNTIFGKTETRGFFKFIAVQIALTVTSIVLLTIAIAIAGVFPVVAGYTGYEILQQIILFLRWPMLMLIGVLGITLLYRYGPCRRTAKRRWMTTGAGIACVLWLIASAGFTIYAGSFGSYNQVFGTLGGVIMLLTWLWLTAFSVLLGAAADAELQLRPH